MPLDIVLDHLVSDVASRASEVTARPHPLAPIVPLDGLELTLHLVAGVPFDTLHELADGDLWRNGDEDVDMICCNNSTDDLHVHLRADLARQVAEAMRNLASKHSLAILRRPDQVQMNSKDTVAAMSVLTHGRQFNRTC